MDGLGTANGLPTNHGVETVHDPETIHDVNLVKHLRHASMEKQTQANSSYCCFQISKSIQQLTRTQMMVDVLMIMMV